METIRINGVEVEVKSFTPSTLHVETREYSDSNGYCHWYPFPPFKIWTPIIFSCEKLEDPPFRGIIEYSRDVKAYYKGWGCNGNEYTFYIEFCECII